MNNFLTEQDVFNLKKESEQKDDTIDELTTLLHSSNVAGSKRISEMEDIIRRKNSTIMRLKKDMMVLEQKLVQLTRDRRPSTSDSTRSSDSWQSSVMKDNLVYDMDSTTSPSSDSDSASDNRKTVPSLKAEITSDRLNDFVSSRNLKPLPSRPKSSDPLVKPINQLVTSRPATPLTESSKFNTLSRQDQFSGSRENKRNRRRIQSAYKDSASHKRWV